MPRKVVSGPDYDDGYDDYDDYDEDYDKYDDTGYGMNQQPAKDEKGMLLAPCKSPYHWSGVASYS
jgi:elongation factor 1 alpha-like protein